MLAISSSWCGSCMVEDCATKDFKSLEPTSRPCRHVGHIHHKTGVENIMNSGMHWIAFSRRSDVVVGVPMEEVGLASAPGDVMAMVKRFMSDGQLCQPAFTFIRAGASSLLPHPTGPNTWVPRDAFTTIDHNNFTRFSGKVHRLLRGKIGALQYLKDWMGKPVQPNTPPDAPLCFQARSVAQGQDFATAASSASWPGRIPSHTGQEAPS